VRPNRAKLVAGVVFALLVSGFLPAGNGSAGASGLGLQTAQAQNLGQRAVSGTVKDSASAPLSGATVFLKNLKTKLIRSYTSTSDGKFRFAQVKMSEDYELWAEKGGKKSAVKTVSSWDTRAEIDYELKIK
jgi:hypothetical protein